MFFKLVFNPKARITKIVSVMLAMILLSEIVLPTVAMALTTNGASQPEVFDYQPVDATDNVSLTTGAFNYTLPITSIPEYPMAISYRSGVKPGMEAGMFGLGFHGFSGAIGRSMMGLPDDINGAKRSYIYRNEKKWSATCGVTLGIAIPVMEALGLGANITVTGGYDNYTGAFGSIAFGISAQGSVGNLGLGVGVSGQADSRGTKGNVGIGASACLGGGINKGNILGLIGISYSQQLGERSSASFDVDISGSAFGISSEMVSSMLSVGISDFPSPSGSLSQSLAPLSNVLPVNKGWGISLSVPLPIGGPVSITINGSYNQFKLDKNDITKTVFGCQYLANYTPRDQSHQADYTVEGEIAFPNDALIKEKGYDPRVNPSYLQRDYFVANAMGFGGTMQLNQQEYGVLGRGVTRFQYRDISLLTVKTKRKESFSWAKVEQAEFNNGVDILKLLKGGSSENDFDAVMFKQKEKASLTTEKHTFGKAEFKMRGDMSGEYNLASRDFSDHEPNEFDLVKVPGSGGSVTGFMRIGKKIDLYEPKAKAATQKMFDQAGKIKKATKITHKTLEEIVTAYESWIEKEPDIADGDNDNFNQSFYNHYNYERNSNSGKEHVHLNEHLETFNLLEHLKAVKDQSPSDISSIIGSVEVQNVSGLKYIFNLPAFAKNSQSLMLTGKAKYAPVIRGDDYKSFGSTDRNKVTSTDHYEYPYAWMLTAIVGEDYIDFDDVPGPSDGDIGYWVKFRYTKTADEYRWRYPFTGLAYIGGAPTTYKDDAYSLSTGLKEIYVLAEIESANYVCKYNYEKRYDGLDAAKRANGSAANPLIEGEIAPSRYKEQGIVPTGENFQFAVSGIDLYKKHPEGDHSNSCSVESPGEIVKSTRFQYDYSLSSEVPNNLANYVDISKSGIDYLYNKVGNINTGRLTLRKIQHIAYGSDGKENWLPAYNFDYWADENPEKYNAKYNERTVDYWGNYNGRAQSENLAPKDSKGEYTADVYFYKPYCEYDKGYANENAKVWHLNQVNLPSGGSLQVDYQAQSYSHVEDKLAYNMRGILQGSLVKVTGDIQGQNTQVAVDVDDICRDELASNVGIPGLQGLRKVMKVGDKIFGEMSFFQSDKKEAGKIYVAATEVDLVRFGDIFLDPQKDRYFQTIEVASTVDDDNPHKQFKPPFFNEVKIYMHAESEQVTCVKQALPMSCDNVESALKKMDEMGKDDPWDALKKTIANFRNVFTGDSKFVDVMNKCFGAPGDHYLAHMSFIRTPVYKGKYTGTRVKTITYSDNFKHATVKGKKEAESNSYGSVYHFDEASDGTGMSAGVATVEPIGGKAAAIDINELVGMGFLPSPSIISGKTTLSGLYNSGSGAVDGSRSREKGKTVYEFYTPKDKSLNYRPTEAIKANVYNGTPKSPRGFYSQFGMIVYILIRIRIFGKKINIKIPIPLPISIYWDRFHNYHMKSYSYLDYTDIYGRPKSITQLNAADLEDGKQEFKYYDVDEAVPVYKEGFASGNLKQMRPGKVDQAWSEAWYSKETDLTMVPALLFFNAKTHRHMNYTNMKYSYIPPVMKEVVTTVDGQKTITKNTGFDYYTGTPVEVRSEDSYGNEKIKRTVPAYWNYPEMGPVDKKETNLNKLTAKSGSFLYLKQTDDKHLLGASVTRWDKSDWEIADYLQPNKVLDGSENYKYKYQIIKGDEIKSAYNTAKRKEDQHIKRNIALYKPVETYTYEVDLKQDGTFSSFAKFNHQGSNNLSWKMISKSELFDANGVLLQASDILGKFVSQHMGYNFSKAISVVANASYAASFYDGAENSYELADGSLALESHKVELGDATIYKGNCDPEYQDHTLVSENYLTGDKATSLELIQVTKPDLLEGGERLAKLNMVFKNEIRRTMFLSVDGQGRYLINSNYGEDFSGFVVLPGAQAGQGYLLFDMDQISSIQVLNDSYLERVTVETVTRDVKADYDDCGVYPLKQYQIPLKDCLGDVHTGDYAFLLEGEGKIGTSIELRKDKLKEVEYVRQYKALVWVMNSAPDGTELVVSCTDGDDNVTEEKITMDLPYAYSGNWVLLRHNFYLHDEEGVDYKKVKIFMRNNSREGLALYDDIRVLPYHAEMSNYIYDHTFDRVTSTLDADNFASFNEYDARGRVSKSKVEINGLGRKTIKQMLYNDQKNAKED